MAYGRSLRGSREAPVCDKGDALAKLCIRGDGLCGIEHLWHARTLRSLVADDHRIARLDLVREYSLYGLLLTVERTGTEHGLEHLLRHGRVLHHRPVWSQIALQNGHGAIGPNRMVEGTYHVCALQAPRLEVGLATLIEATGFQSSKVFSHRLACDGERIEVQHRLDFLHHGWHTPCIVEELRRPAPSRSDVEQVMRSAMHAVEGVCIYLYAQLVGHGWQMEQGVGGARDGSMHHDGILYGFHGDDVAGLDALLDEPEYLFASLVGLLLQVGTGGRHQGRAWQHEAQCLCHDLHGAGCAHERTGTTRRTGMLLIVGELRFCDFATLAHGRVGPYLLQCEEIGPCIHHTPCDDDRGHVEAA